jgi:hypothetical protein
MTGTTADRVRGGLLPDWGSVTRCMHVRNYNQEFKNKEN